MKLVLAFVSVCLTGCASIVPDTPFQPLSPADRLTNRTMVTWDTVDDINSTCKELGVSVSKDSVVHGCAVMTKNYCKIYTSKTTTMPILGHEFRHCFEGNFHK